jgi:hypothetical protein
VELKKKDTVAVIYFEYLDSKVVCLNAEAYQTNIVNNPKGGVVTVYDYYEGSKFRYVFNNYKLDFFCFFLFPARRAVATYEVPQKVNEA